MISREIKKKIMANPKKLSNRSLTGITKRKKENQGQTILEEIMAEKF